MTTHETLPQLEDCRVVVERNTSEDQELYGAPIYGIPFEHINNSGELRSVVIDEVGPYLAIDAARPRLLGVNVDDEIDILPLSITDDGQEITASLSPEHLRALWKAGAANKAAGSPELPPIAQIVARLEYFQEILETPGLFTIEDLNRSLKGEYRPSFNSMYYYIESAFKKITGDRDVHLDDIGKYLPNTTPNLSSVSDYIERTVNTLRRYTDSGKSDVFTEHHGSYLTYEIPYEELQLTHPMYPPMIKLVVAKALSGQETGEPTDELARSAWAQVAATKFIQS